MADKIQMIAIDTIHVSAVQSDPLRAGDKFHVDSEDDAQKLEALGHKRVKASAPAKAEPAASRTKAKPTKK